ncbi:MAG: cupin-like domain-containing protein [Sphingomonadales bacterium]|nr:cupin-like domain-containing protein [Sphingomonadales bacterium]
MDMTPSGFVPASRRAFDEEARRAFAAAYPTGACVLRHALADHPLLSLDALADAAGRMRPDCVLYKRASEPLQAVVSLASHPADHVAMVRDIATADLWVGFNDASQLPEYADLIASVLGELDDLIRPITGPARRLKAFIFVSSPRAKFPFHVDPEYNILAQIAGRKRFAVFPPQPPFLTDRQNEAFHRHGINALEWREDFAAHGTVYTLDPGDALHHTFKAPHWVEVDDQPSVSISLTWCSDASLEQNEAWTFNGWLREHGLNPSPPAPLPHGRSRVKANAWRALRRLGCG